MATPAYLLLVDDSPGECELFRLALAQYDAGTTLQIVHDSAEALHRLNTQSTLPAVILLDWKPRGPHGNELLKRLRTDAQYSTLPIVIFSASEEVSDLTLAYAGGANGYVVKPATFTELVQCVGDICRYWMGRNRTPATVLEQC